MRFLGRIQEIMGDLHTRPRAPASGHPDTILAYLNLEWCSCMYRKSAKRMLILYYCLLKQLARQRLLCGSFRQRSCCPTRSAWLWILWWLLCLSKFNIGLETFRRLVWRAARVMRTGADHLAKGTASPAVSFAGSFLGVWSILR